MKGAFRIAKVAGIPVEIHWSFVLMGIYIIYFGQSRGGDWQAIMWFGLLVFSLFFCVVLHEFGHALTARRFGVKTKDIILSPIGGVARLEKLPEKPMHEFYVAIAGPLVNVLIVILLLPYFLFYSLEEVKDQISSFSATLSFSNPVEIIPLLILGNVLLAGFNMLPAFPMDGGRVFRALLSIKLGRLKATKFASLIGNFFGVLMLVYAVYAQSLTSGFIGVFVFLLATQEYRMVRMDEALKNHFLSEVFRSNFTRILATDKMSSVIDAMKHGLEKSFLVFDENEKVIGVLHEMFILEAIKKKDLESSALEYMSESFEEVKPEISLQTLVFIMREKGYSILPVVEDDQLKGVIDVEMLNNFLKLQQKVV